MVRCYIIGDKYYAIEILKDFIEQTPGLEFAGSNLSAIDGLAAILNQEVMVDLLFLDRQMPQISAIKLTDLIKTNTTIVLTAGLTDYGNEAYQTGIHDNQLQPIAYEKFLKSIAQFIQRKQTHNDQLKDDDFLYIKSDTKGKLMKIDFNSIYYVSVAYVK